MSKQFESLEDWSKRAEIGVTRIMRKRKIQKIKLLIKAKENGSTII